MEKPTETRSLGSWTTCESDGSWDTMWGPRSHTSPSLGTRARGPEQQSGDRPVAPPGPRPVLPAASTASRSQALRPRGSGTCASAQARPSLLTPHVQPVPLHVFLRPACPSTLTPSRGPQPGSGRTPRPHIHLRLSLHLPPGEPTAHTPTVAHSSRHRPSAPQSQVHARPPREPQDPPGAVAASSAHAAALHLTQRRHLTSSRSRRA